MGGITLVLVLILAVLNSVHSSKTVIYVDSSSQTGVNDSCRKESNSIHCLSLNQALKEAQQFSNSIAIFLKPGQHQLRDGSETQLRNMTQLAIVGNTSSRGESVVIKCLPLAGLSFLRSNNITLNKLKIAECGALQNSIKKHARDIMSSNMQSAIFINACNNVRFINIDIIDSNGTGIILYNPSGLVLLDMCNFINNGLSSVESSIIGGGGLVIEANDATSSYNCIVMNCTFSGNAAKTRRLLILPQVQANDPSQYFGLGGGITIVFRGGASNNIVQLTKVKFDNNTAQFGGGLYLAIFDSASSNDVTIDGIVVTHNTATMLEVGIMLPFASGGGISIDLAASEVDYPFNNTIEILNSKFISNTAQLGGGIAVDVVYDAYGCVNADNKLLIENCNFENNEGCQGSSAYFLGTTGCRALLNTTLSSNIFSNGHIPVHYAAVLPCLGSVTLSQFQITIRGILLLSENSYTALSLTASSIIELLSLAQLIFSNNSGFNGAALHIVDCSSVIVNDNTSIYLENNKARNHGGAIYSETCDQTIEYCFIRHSNSKLDPSQWKTNVSFVNNEASSLGNSIYMDSIQSCVIPQHNLSMAFCWEGWSYWSSGQSDSCHHNQFRSGPSYIINNGPTMYTAYPGGCVNLQQIIVFDHWGNDISDQTVLQVDVLSDSIRAITSNDPNCYCNFAAELTANYYESEQIPCEAHEFVLLSNCNEDYDNYSSKIMIHPQNQQYGIIIDFSFKTCDNKTICYSSSTNEPFSGACSTQQFNTQNPIPYRAFCNVTNFTDGYYDINEQVCGRCLAETNDAMIVNMPIFNCIKCTDYSGVGFFLMEILLVMIMMTILAVLHINITNGNLNGYILYSQMVTLQFPGLGYSAWVPSAFSPCGLSHFEYISIPLTVYSIWNLNFLTLIPDPFCIPGIRTAVDVFLLQYLIAACPLLFIIVSYTWIQCYNNGYRLVVYTTRPLHRLMAHFWQKFEIQPSLIDAYAGLLLLAYMRILAVSIKLLQFISIDHHFVSPSPAFFALFVTAILCLLVFVILPIAVLLLYPFKIFQRCLTCCRLNRPGLHALIDAYQGCFKNSATDGSERRYFAGIYLLFRFFYVLLLFFLSPVFGMEWTAIGALQLASPISGACLSFLLAGLVLILRPYRKPAHNVIDFLTLILMTLFAALSVFTSLSFIVFLGPLFLPFLVLLAYLLAYPVFKVCRSRYMYNAYMKQNVDNSSSDNDNNLSEAYDQQPLLPVTTSVVEISDYAEDDEYPDRMVHPDEYT